jgi:predicted nucleic-acid-binding Zn-ribbon protein
LAEFSPETLTSWLNAKGFEFKCPVCGSEEYQASENLIRISSPAPGLHWGQPFQGAYIYCAECGYTMFFNAEKLPLEEA